MQTESIQVSRARTDVGVGTMHNRLGERRRTIVALVGPQLGAASVISVVIWGLIVVLHIQ